MFEGTLARKHHRHLGGGLFAYGGGVVFDIMGSYRLAFVISALMAATAAMSALLIRGQRQEPRR